MTDWRPNWASALPRTAVLAHDLIMVWLSWNGLRLVRHGLAGEAALQRIVELRRACRGAARPSPETDAQRALVRGYPASR